ncbi:MAG TPA: DUF1634 domain-containing protein [Candidatus Kapabacteria bacterium]
MTQETTDHSIEIFIGNLLRVCVIATVAVVAVGAILFLPTAYGNRPSYAVFRSEPAMFRSVSTILSAAFSGDGKAIMQSGMLLLILTPILRVAFSVIAFLYEKDYLYVGMTVLVLGLLIFSLAGG